MQTSYHKQTTIETVAVDILPTSPLHKEQIRIGGEARDIAVLVNARQSRTGEMVEVLLAYQSPLVVGLVTQINNTDGTPLVEITSDGIQPNALVRLVADGLGSLDLWQLTIPASII